MAHTLLQRKREFFSLKSVTRDTLFRVAEDSLPSECCGVIATGDCENQIVIPARNDSPYPRYSYSIDPADQYRIFKRILENHWTFSAIYHSHPTDKAWPSGEDVDSAYWQVPYIIIGLHPKEIEVFVIKDRSITVKL